MLAVLAALALLFFANYIYDRYSAGTAGNDFWDAYLRASRHLAQGQSPYAESFLAGPIPSQTPQAYLYPPTFAWLLTPFLTIPQSIATDLWAFLQVVFLGLAAWIAASCAGARHNVRLILALFIAIFLFGPDISTVLTGNVGAIVALGTALLLRGARANPKGDGSAGPIAAALGVLKLTPGLMLLPLILADPKRHLPGALLTAAILVIPFFLLNPGPWFDFSHIPGNLAAGSNWYDSNLAPDVVFSYYLPATAFLSPLLYFATLAISLVLLAVSALLARRPGGLPLAIIAASGAAILPLSSIWPHYLAALLPGIVYTFVQAKNRWRWVIILCFIASWPVNLSFTMPLFSVAMVVLMVVPIFALWPQDGIHPELNLKPAPANLS